MSGLCGLGDICIPISRIYLMRDFSTYKYIKFERMTAEVFRILFYDNLLPCANPRHKQHLKRFLKKYPTSDKNGEFPIITVNPEDWAISLEDPKTNTTECCQMCSISEDIISTSSQRNEPDRYCSCQ
jgi:hypothetical protein